MFCIFKLYKIHKYVLPHLLILNIAVNNAGTPINIDLDHINTAVTAASGSGSSKVANAVLLHNVDVTEGAANGTALIWGFVNKNRVESDVLALINAVSDSGAVTFLTV